MKLDARRGHPVRRRSGHQRNRDDSAGAGAAIGGLAKTASGVISGGNVRMRHS
jgi:hypothetical protein